MALKKGNIAPNFSLNNQDGQAVDLYERLKQGPLVLFFFPKAFTRVCTQEACSFGDQIERFEKLKAQIFGVSTDSEKTLKRFQKSYNLSYDLLSDASAIVSKLYDAYVPFVGISSRVTYVIDQDSSIKEVYSGMLKAQPHINNALKSLGL